MFGLVAELLRRVPPSFVALMATWSAMLSARDPTVHNAATRMCGENESYSRRTRDKNRAQDQS
jgi:hypothetical protein